MTSRNSMTTSSDMVLPMMHYVNASDGGGDATMSSVSRDLVTGNSGEWVNHINLLAANNNVAVTHKYVCVLTVDSFVAVTMLCGTRDASRVTCSPRDVASF